VDAPSKLRAWIKTNIIGDSSTSDFRAPQSPKPQSKEEQLQAEMDDLKFMPPDPFPAEGGINKKLVEFWVEKLLDLALSGIGALFVWIVLKVTGKRLFPEQPHGAEAIETIGPAIIWVVCYVRLCILRARQKSFYGVANMPDGCIMVPLSRSKRKFRI